MTILFSNSSLKVPKLCTFGPKFEDFYFHIKLYNKADSRALISNMTIVFQNCYPEQPSKVFLVIDLRIFIFLRNFAFSKNLLTLFKFEHKSTPKIYFLSQIYAFLFLRKI